MKRVGLSLMIAVLMTTAAAWAVVGQEGGIGSFDPFSIHVTHQEPVTVVATTTVDSGEVVTVTVPITVGVDLRVNVTGPGVVSVESAGAAESEVAVEPVESEPVADAPLVDVSGISYEVIAPDGVTIEQVKSSELASYINIEGIVMNGSDEELQFVSVSLELYDTDGELIGIEGAATNPRNVDPGSTFSFEGAPAGDFAELGHYVVRID
ncbi:FxLYD domain-containing protein [Candidatus Kaiserbacteria bacterium]|nr:FxLYD domain-containing protein [Candidatus Kaiserbacteria bacterium]